MSEFWSAMKWQFGFDKKPDLPSWSEMSEPVAKVLDRVSNPAASIVRNTGKAADSMEAIIEHQRKSIAMMLAALGLLTLINLIDLVRFFV